MARFLKIPSPAFPLVSSSLRQKLKVCLFSDHNSPTMPNSFTPAVIQKTANFVANSQNPPLFEDKIRENQRSDPKFSFLNPVDPYYAYYKDRLDRLTRGESLDDDATPTPGGTGSATPSGAAGGAEIDAVDIGIEPPAPEFTLDMPNISNFDLYVVPSFHRILRLA